MRLVTRKRLFIVIVGIASLFALSFHYKERYSYQCQLCFSRKDVFQWRLGSWGGAGSSVPLSPNWERLEESEFRHDFFGADHVHDWNFIQGSPYYFFGTKWGGCALGAGRDTGALYQTYESAPDFRAFVQAKLHDGSLTKSNVIAMMSEPPSHEDTPLQKDSDALLHAFYSR